MTLLTWCLRVKRLDFLIDIGNNYIKELHSIFPLKDLQRLIILDMNGNEICSSKDYRLFMIFHLARLKVG